jgi:signal transduction histidine kinase
VCFNRAVSGVESVAAQAMRVAAGMLSEPGRPAPRLVWLLEQRDGELLPLAAPGLGSVRPRLDGAPAAREAFQSAGAAGTALDQLGDVLAAELARHGVGSVALARVDMASVPPGLLLAGFEGDGGLSARCLSQMEGIAGLVGLAVAPALASARRLELAISAAEDIGSHEQLSDVVSGVLRHAAGAVRADRGTISRAEGETMVVEFEFALEGAPATVGRRWKLKRSELAVESVRLQRPIRGGVQTAALSGTVAHLLESWNQGSFISCPLMVDGELIGLMGLSRTVTNPFDDDDLRTLEPLAALAALLLRNARLMARERAASGAKDTLFNLAAHELRTPLTVIRAYLSLLEDGTYPVPDRTRDDVVQTLVGKALELDALVETLVLSARAEAGALPAAPCPLDVCAEVREATARIAARARLEGARLELTLPEPRVGAYADRDHVAHILDNLLNNALTYSQRPARVTVEVRAGDPVAIAVNDLGLGIPAGCQARVFERFYRVEGARRGPGLGLGLSISRELAGLSGGSLDLERSVHGEGSVFVLRLPAHP